MDVAPYERPIFNRVLILGWNSIVDILREFEGHAVQEVTVTIVSSHSEGVRRAYFWRKPSQRPEPGKGNL